VGAALTQAIQQGIVSRDEVLICTKAGYLPGMWPQASPAASMPAVSMPAVSMPDDVVADVHSMDPAFLARQIASSAQRMGLETIDVVYIQNPDIRLFFENVGTFMQRVQAAFEGLEQQVTQGTIRFYGMAVDEGFLADPSAQNHLPLYKLVQVAEAIAGPNHHFRFVQFPYHMGMSTGLITSNQPVRTKDGDVVRRTDMPMLAAALQYGITAVTCAGLYQGTLADELPEGGGKAWARRMGKIDRQRPSPAQASLHFNRSTPGLTTTLFSTTDPAHLAENLAIAPLEPWAADPFISFMGG
jgi:aryl-alcohol dehydrogenase-like predicted oxidoreductase